MEGAYLPGNIRQRMQELMKEHKITQAQLATRIGSTESAISRFVSGKTDKISTEHLLRIAKVFEVSTDFLLGEVNTPDRTNFDIEELGLSVQAARNLYTGKANAEIVNRLLESPRFAEVTYMIEQYFDDTLAAGFAGQNQMLYSNSDVLIGDHGELVRLSTGYSPDMGRLDTRSLRKSMALSRVVLLIASSASSVRNP